MRRPFAILKSLIWIAAAGAALLVAYAFLKARPEDLPWTRLDLGQPIGTFTGRKLAALTADAEGCRALLDKAGVAYRAQPPVAAGVQCGFSDAVRLSPAAGAVRLSPVDVGPSCPVAAALKLWEWHVVQPEAQRLLGSPVRTIENFGVYNCRRMYGRSTGDMSEHATADAIDIAGFVLADGRRITVARDWPGDGPEATFLRRVRNGACELFSTTLSPDYNRAHHDHLHLDQAERGAGVMGRRVCR